MSTTSATKIPTCYASCSIGTKPEHNLPTKLRAIAAAGFDAIELSFPDLQAFAATATAGGGVSPSDYRRLCESGKEVKQLCKDLGLKIMVLQPFANFEGWPEGSKEREDAFRGVDEDNGSSRDGYASDSPNITSSIDQLARDLAQLADLLAPKGFRIAYENWCWATHAPTWETVWEIVQKADRPNIGLCLDTFQTAGGEWGDPTTKSGKIVATPDPDKQDTLEESFHDSLKKLAATIPKDKIYFLQISDAYHMDPPLASEPDADGLRPRGRWSHSHRPLPFDGGYLPIVEVTKAVLGTGFRGWFSVEVFDGRLAEKHGHDMVAFAKKAMDSHNRLLAEVGA